MAECRFPDVLKIACVTPIHKKGSIHLASNYRPISILPILSKVFERLLKGQMMMYLEDELLLNVNQHGFRQGKSTGTSYF